MNSKTIWDKEAWLNQNKGREREERGGGGAWCDQV